jgi:hypothetical protein
MRNFFTKFITVSLVFIFLGGVNGWGQSLSITSTSMITDNVGSYAGSSGTLPSYWYQQGSGTNGTNQAGTNQAAGTSGGWYGSGATNNGGMSFLGSSSASNGNATLILQNNTGVTIVGFTLSFTARMFRSQANSPTVSVSWNSGSSVSNPTQGALANTLSSLGFSDATTNISTGTTLTQTVSSISVANGQYIYIRWIHSGGSSSDNLGWNAIQFTASTATPSIAISAGGIGSGTPNNGQTNVVLQRYDMAVTSANASLTGLTVTTAGTYAASDLTNLKVRYSTDATLDAGDATLSTKTTGLGAGSQVFPSFTAQALASGSTYYIFVTADIASGATNGSTINVGTTSFSNISFASGNKTGTDPVAAGGTQTITVTTPNVALSSPVASASNIVVGTTDIVLYRFDLGVTNASATLSGLTVTTSGTYVASDLTNLKVRYSADATLDVSDATLSTKTTGLGAGSQVFPSFTSQSISAGSTGYIFITADLPFGATLNNSISINAVTISDLTFTTTVTNSGSTNASGAKTIIDCTPTDVSSAAASSANQSSVLTWTNPSCFSEILVVASTSSNNASPTGDGTAYTANLAYGSGTAIGNGFVVYKGATSNQTVTSLTNGQQYFFKFFTRRGTTWTSGTETSATPSITGYYWNGASITANPANGGTGTWGTANAWRQPSATGAQATWADANNAVFAGTAGTVTLDADRSATTYYFNTTGYTLASTSGTTRVLTGPIVLGNNVGLTFSPNVNITTPATGRIDVGSISGSGTANITITAAQGTATNIGQRLNIPTANATISVPINITSAGGTGTNTVAGIASTATGVTLTSAATITNNSAIKTSIGATSGNNITVNGVISGSGDLLFATGSTGGAGTTTLNAANTYTGATYFNSSTSGTIKLGITNALPSTTNVTMGYTSGNGGIWDLNGFNQTIASLASNTGGVGSIRNDGATDVTLTVNGSTSTSFGLAINDGTTNKIALVKSGSGVLTLTGTSGYTGGTTINSGATIELGSATTLSNTGAITLNGGIFSTGVGYSETVGVLNLTSSSTITLGSNNHTLTFSNSSGSSWTGTLTITGWTGTAGVSGNTAGKIVVGANGLTTGQLASINFQGYANGATIVSGELVPVVPPITYYYYKGTGSVTAADSWTDDVTLVAGNSPSSVDATQTFTYWTLQNGNSASLLGSWALGTGSKIIVGGTNAFNLTVPSGTPITGGLGVDVASNGTLTLQNATVPTFGTLASGSTVNYAGTGITQTLTATNYSNLILSGSGTRTFPSGTVGISGTFTTGSFTSASTGTVNFNGTSAQIIPAFTFNNLTTSNTAGCTTGGSLICNAALTVTENLVVANTHTLTIGSGGSVNVASTKSLTINNTGILQNNSTTAFTLTGSLIVNGTYVHNANSSTIPGVSPASGVTYGSSSTINVGNGLSGVTSVLPTLPSAIAGNVIWNTPNGSFSATAFFQTTPTTISGNFTIVSTGATLFNSSASTARTLNIGGNLEIQGGNYSISAAGSTVSPITNVTGNVIISGGTLDINGGTSTGTSTLNVGGNFTHTAGTLTKSGSATGVINFNGTTAQTIESIGHLILLKPEQAEQLL